ncbi:MAG TPA: hemerythrin domain-containing protein [Nocardioides sp.]|nr:hemerythrin domain-containing protein [Nocardioides sp.]
MAAPSMSMNKTIHCAVRRDLKRFRAALDAFPDGDRDRAAALHRAWQNFDAQLTEHHEGEHEIAWPALKAMGVAESSISTFDEEHDAMAADLTATRAAMDQFARSASRADADAAAAAMAKLETTTVTHLEHEEQETEPVLAANVDHPAYKQMARQFSRRSGMATAGTFFAWMDDGASPEERAAIRENVPGPVLTIMGTIFGRKYRKEVAPVWASSGSS